MLTCHCEEERDEAISMKLRTIDTFVLHRRGIASPQRGSQ
jgi:hypothetical protein